jgi:hypothetical protein
VDGIASGSTANITTTVSGNAADTLRIGNDHYIINNTYYHGFKGSMDEIRFSNDNRSAAWIKLEYYSMWTKTTWPGDGWLSWGSERGSE